MIFKSSLTFCDSISAGKEGDSGSFPVGMLKPLSSCSPLTCWLLVRHSNCRTPRFTSHLFWMSFPICKDSLLGIILLVITRCCWSGNPANTSCQVPPETTAKPEWGWASLAAWGGVGMGVEGQQQSWRWAGDLGLGDDWDQAWWF